MLKTMVSRMGYLKWEKWQTLIDYINREENEKKTDDLKNLFGIFLFYYRIMKKLAMYKLGNKISFA